MHEVYTLCHCLLGGEGASKGAASGIHGYPFNCRAKGPSGGVQGSSKGLPQTLVGRSTEIATQHITFLPSAALHRVTWDFSNRHWLAGWVIYAGRVVYMYIGHLGMIQNRHPCGEAWCCWHGGVNTPVTQQFDLQCHYPKRWDFTQWYPGLG